MQRGFGDTTRTGGIQTTDHTVYHMASISKTFVSLAIMQLVAAGRCVHFPPLPPRRSPPILRLTLDDNLVQHLPYFQLPDPRCTPTLTDPPSPAPRRYRDIRIRHLVSLATTNTPYAVKHVQSDLIHHRQVSHTSGLPDVDDYEWYAPPPDCTGGTKNPSLSMASTHQHPTNTLYPTPRR